jgi:hypothetical protein
MSSQFVDPPPLRSNHPICHLVVGKPYFGFAETGISQSFLQLFQAKWIVDDWIRSDRSFSASLECEKHFNGMSFVEAFGKGPYIGGQASLPSAFSPLKVRESRFLFPNLLPVD